METFSEVASEIASWTGAHPGGLAIGAGLVAAGLLTAEFIKDVVWPSMRPARPVTHSAKTQDAIAQANSSMQKIGLGTPEGP